LQTPTSTYGYSYSGSWAFNALTAPIKNSYCFKAIISTENYERLKTKLYNIQCAHRCVVHNTSVVWKINIKLPTIKSYHPHNDHPVKPSKQQRENSAEVVKTGDQIVLIHSQTWRIRNTRSNYIHHNHIVLHLDCTWHHTVTPDARRGDWRISLPTTFWIIKLRNGSYVTPTIASLINTNATYTTSLLPQDRN